MGHILHLCFSLAGPQNRPEVDEAGNRINWAELQRISKFGALHMLLLHMAADMSHTMINSSRENLSGCGDDN